MKLSNLILLFVLAIFFSSCLESGKTKIVIIKNLLDLDRSYETVELNKSFLKVESLGNVGIQDVETNELQITQLVDEDGDGVMDKLLFQPKVAANSEKHFAIISIRKEEQPQPQAFCYSRFVPERTDDYAWENDRVAFRVYGPTAQKMKEDGVKGGTLSSGVDAWLKKVNYPIINKWYKKYVDKTGSYHEDTGEGLDNFHVGSSRGVGGIAVKGDSSYYFSKNFTAWRTITTGPIRTSFYLEYEDWNADEKMVNESRIISLDLGSNLSKFEISIAGVDSISAGLTLHENDGIVSSDNESWISYWQPHGDSELGTAIITAPNTFIGFEKYETQAKDLSNAYAHLKVENNKVLYYAGFGWGKSGQFKTQQEWEQYLMVMAEKIKVPLIVSLQDK